MKICVFTLGCKVNESESGSIIQGLRDEGFEVFGGLNYADLYVVNTCAVTKEAEKKSRQAIARIKKCNPKATVIATGCAVEKSYADFLEKEGVLYVCGTQKKSLVIGEAKRLATALQKREDLGEKKKEIQENKVFDDLPVSRSPRTRADIKIEDGCNNFCSYCIVPYLRGRERSRDALSIRTEIETLRPIEAVLTGINTSAYHSEIGGLADLLRYLSDLPVRIRLGSLEVRVVTEDLLNACKSMYDFAPQFHLSLQSGCDRTLKAMNRHYTAREYAEKVALIRSYFPNASVTTDVISGFPTETDEDFEESYRFCEEIAFSDIHCFPYSPREGTVASKLKDLPSMVKKQRNERMLALAERLKEQYSAKFIGAELCMIAEENDGEKTFGYTENYLRVAVKGTLPKGKYLVKIVKESNGVNAELIKEI